MANELKTNLHPEDLEYLSFEQAAAICSISEERLARWIEKGMLPVITINDKSLIRSQDLIQHLIRHNIRIPDRLLQGSTKKILFILMQAEISAAMTRDIIWALYRQREHSAYIFDFIQHDENTELKIITFAPDAIFLLKSGDTQAGQTTLNISTMLGREIPIHHFSVDQTIDIDTLLND
ncbi:MAG: helix-turn-helix domain-containing protein [Desulfobulbus sp.]|nr:helix-turn-helix domain-containing protein [Desulfobulbus sp.]